MLLTVTQKTEGCRSKTLYTRYLTIPSAIPCGILVFRDFYEKRHIMTSRWYFDQGARQEKTLRTSKIVAGSEQKQTDISHLQVASRWKEGGADSHLLVE